jgi:hypothetical protein
MWVAAIVIGGEWMAARYQEGRVDGNAKEERACHDCLARMECSIVVSCGSKAGCCLEAVMNVGHCEEQARRGWRRTSFRAEVVAGK